MNNVSANFLAAAVAASQRRVTQVQIWSGPSASYDTIVSGISPSAWFKLTDSVGSTSAADSAGSYTLTKTGTVTFGQVGPISGIPSETAALFDGSTGYLKNTTSPLGTTPTSCSLVAWFKSTSATKQQIAGVFGGAGFFDIYLNSSGNIVFECGGSSAPNDITTTTTYNDGNWHMAAIVFDGVYIYGYVDGVAVIAQTIITNALSFTSPFIQIGDNASGNFFNGTIAQVGIWTTVLSLSQIQQLFVASSTVQTAPTLIQDLTQYVSVATWSEDESQSPRRTCSVTLESKGFGSDILTLVPQSAGDLLHPLTGNELRIFDGYIYNVTTVVSTPQTGYDLLMASMYPQAWWKLADAASSTSAIDSSGAGDTGTVNGTVAYGQTSLISGTPADTSALFDGSTGYVSAPLVSSATTGVTLIGWFTMPSGSTHGAIIKLGNSSSGFGIGVGGGTMDANGTTLVGLYESIRWIATGVTVSPGTHMIALVVDASGYPHLYLDGAQVYTDTTGAPNAPSGNTFIGGYPGVTRFFGGKIAQTAVFTSALNATQILALYNAAPQAEAAASTKTVVTPTTEVTPCGVYRISKPKIDDDGTKVEITITGNDRMFEVSRRSYTAPYVINTSPTYDVAIKALINFCLPGLTYNFTPFTQTVPNVVFGSQGMTSAVDPSSDAIQLATAVGAEVFFDSSGVCVLRPLPDPTQLPSVLTFIEGANCTVGEVTRTLDETITYNTVILTGSPAGVVYPVQVQVSVSDPASPVYPGKCGYLPYYYTSTLISTSAQATLAASAMLQRLLTAFDATTMNAVSNSALCAGDVITISRARMRINAQKYCASQLQWSSDVTQWMSVTNRTGRSVTGV